MTRKHSTCLTYPFVLISTILLLFTLAGCGQTQYSAIQLPTINKNAQPSLSPSPSEASNVEEIGGNAIAENATDVADPAMVMDEKESAIPAQVPINHTQPQKNKVALLLPLSGSAADLGKNIQRAAELALFDIDDPGLILMPYDTKGTELGAIDAAKEAVKHGARIIIGPLFRHTTRAIAPVTRRHNINVVSFSNDQSLGKEGVFLLGFSPTQQITRVVSYALEKGIGYFAALVPNDAYGSMVAEAMRNVVDENGGEVIKTEFYLPENRLVVLNARRIIKTARNALEFPSEENTVHQLGSPVGLLVPEGGKKLEKLLDLFDSYHVTNQEIQLLGSGQWDDPSIKDVKNLRNGWYASAPSSLRHRFEKKFEDIYGKKPERIVSLAYDGVALAATLARYDTRTYTRNLLTNPRGYMGIDGIFRLKDDGTCERGFAVYEISNGKSKMIQGAPKSFLR